MKYTSNAAQGQTILNNVNTRGIAFSPEEQAIYFSNYPLNTQRIERANKNGLRVINVIVPAGVLTVFYSLIVRPEGIYICDTNNHQVILWFNNNSSYVNIAGGNGIGTDSKHLKTPEGIFIDDNLDIYVADTRNHRIQLWKKEALEGITVAGSLLSLAGSSLKELRNPAAVIVDRRGTMFIADTGNHRILQWLKGDTQAKLVLVENTGESGLSPNQLNTPTSLKFDAQGNLIVVDNENNRTQNYLVDNSHC